MVLYSTTRQATTEGPDVITIGGSFHAYSDLQLIACATQVESNELPAVRAADATIGR